MLEDHCLGNYHLKAVYIASDFKFPVIKLLLIYK